MIWWAFGGALYAIGAGGTFIFNRAIIVGPVNYPMAVVRNALLWPIFLPFLIYAAKAR